MTVNLLNVTISENITDSETRPAIVQLLPENPDLSILPLETMSFVRAHVSRLFQRQEYLFRFL